MAAKVINIVSSQCPESAKLSPYVGRGLRHLGIKSKILLWYSTRERLDKLKLVGFSGGFKT